MKMSFNSLSLTFTTKLFNFLFVCLSRFDEIGGLSSRTVTLPGETRPVELCCIGDEEIVGSKKRVTLMPANPFLKRSMTLKIENLVVKIDDRMAFEDRLIRETSSNLFTTSDAHISSRCLKIGKRPNRTTKKDQKKDGNKTYLP